MSHKIKITCKGCGRVVEIEGDYNSPDNDDGVEIMPVEVNEWTLIRCDCGNETRLKYH